MFELIIEKIILIIFTPVLFILLLPYSMIVAIIRKGPFYSNLKSIYSDHIKKWIETILTT